MPDTALALLDGAGVLAYTVPERDGGPGGGPVVLAEVTRRIAVADPSLAQIPQGHFLMVDVLAAAGSAEQRERLLGAVVAGERIGNRARRARRTSPGHAGGARAG